MSKTFHGLINLWFYLGKIKVQINTFIYFISFIFILHIYFTFHFLLIKPQDEIIYLRLQQNQKRFLESITMKTDRIQNIFANSSSKQKWSFSKSRRFIEPKSYNAGFYISGSSLDKRSASFGVGERIELAKKTRDSADPVKYNISSSFDNKRRGFSFGTGRDQTKFQNYLKMLATSTQTIYKIDDSSLHKGKAFSIKQRTTYPPNYFLPNDPQKQRRSKLPGPTSYQTIDQIGQKCVSSKNKNIGYHFNLGRRFSKMKTIEVGPGSYDDRTITADGHFILSNMKSSGRRTINQGKKKSIFEKTEHIPGPGQYDIVGDFGQLKLRQNTDTSHLQKPKRPQTARN